MDVGGERRGLLDIYTTLESRFEHCDIRNGILLMNDIWIHLPLFRRTTALNQTPQRCRSSAIDLSLWQRCTQTVVACLRSEIEIQTAHYIFEHQSIPRN
jgi:hypothetical protein